MIDLTNDTGLGMHSQDFRTNVLNTPELLSHVLLSGSCTDVLIWQQVSKFWYECITSSPTYASALCLKSLTHSTVPVTEDHYWFHDYWDGFIPMPVLVLLPQSSSDLSINDLCATAHQCSREGTRMLNPVFAAMLSETHAQLPVPVNDADRNHLYKADLDKIKHITSMKPRAWSKMSITQSRVRTFYFSMTLGPRISHRSGRSPLVEYICGAPHWRSTVFATRI